jgi:hypothetical protein
MLSSAAQPASPGDDISFEARLARVLTTTRTTETLEQDERGSCEREAPKISAWLREKGKQARQPPKAGAPVWRQNELQ